MALKKNFKKGSKYYYGLIHSITYSKSLDASSNTTDHTIQIALQVRDENKPDYKKTENELFYTIPSGRMKEEPIVSVVPKLNENGEEIRENGELVTHEVQNGTKMVFDDTYEDPFSVDKMNPEGQNIAKLAYVWLTENIELFSDFEIV